MSGETAFVGVAETRRRRLARPTGIALLVSLLVLGILNVFGQSPSTYHARGSAGVLRLEAPPALRGGLLWEGRFEVAAQGPLAVPTLVLEAGWSDGMTINTIEPSPAAETSRDGRLILEFDRMATGEHLTVSMHFQVDPTTVGRRDQGAGLFDGAAPVARISRTVTVFP